MAQKKGILFAGSSSAFASFLQEGPAAPATGIEGHTRKHSISLLRNDRLQCFFQAHGRHSIIDFGVMAHSSAGRPPCPLVLINSSWGRAKIQKPENANDDHTSHGCLLSNTIHMCPFSVHGMVLYRSTRLCFDFVISPCIARLPGLLNF